MPWTLLLLFHWQIHEDTIWWINYPLSLLSICSHNAMHYTSAQFQAVSPRRHSLNFFCIHKSDRSTSMKNEKESLTEKFPPTFTPPPGQSLHEMDRHYTPKPQCKQLSISPAVFRQWSARCVEVWKLAGFFFFTQLLLSVFICTNKCNTMNIFR